MKYTGLNDLEIQERIQNNLVNFDTTVKSKSIKVILMTNIFTLFNILNFSIAIIIFFTGQYKNLLFLGVVFSNTLISIIQEIKAKKQIEKLSLIAASKATVIRNSEKRNINIYEIVKDDLLILKSGEQVLTDSIVIDGYSEVDESFITGESEHITVEVDDTIKSGSFIISGEIIVKVINVGNDNYTAKINSEAKYIKYSTSVLMKSLKTIIKWISIIIIPLGIILFINQLNINSNYSDAIITTSAAVIGMIPEGLILLTSTVLAVSIIKLSQHNILVKDLFCIETLARVDTLCLDKTGTITTGEMIFKKAIPTKEYSKKEIDSKDNNSTMAAIKKHYSNDLYAEITSYKLFNSKLKYSNISFKNKGTYFIGAPEILLKKQYGILSKQLENDLLNYRILVLAHSKKENEDDITNLQLMAILYIEDIIRDDAKTTLDYFRKQNIDIRIISGDNVKTLSGIAKRSGFKEYDNYIDMTTINIEDIDKISNKYNIFGRVNPIQKKELIRSFKKDGKFTAMIGDGVNDILALKESDCSISIGSGCEAAKNISDITLLNDKFNSIPLIFNEGRKTINNIEKSASLYLNKTIYSTLLSIIFLFVDYNYVFIPIQLTLTSVVTIGIPSFILALQPNTSIVKGNFITNILTNSLPTACLITINIITILFVGKTINLTDLEITTLCVLMNAIISFRLLYKLSTPFNKINIILFISMIIIFLLGFTLLRSLFSLTNISLTMLIFTFILTSISLILFEILTNIKKR